MRRSRHLRATHWALVVPLLVAGVVAGLAGMHLGIAPASSSSHSLPSVTHGAAKGAATDQPCGAPGFHDASATACTLGVPAGTLAFAPPIPVGLVAVCDVAPASSVLPTVATGRSPPDLDSLGISRT